LRIRIPGSARRRSIWAVSAGSAVVSVQLVYPPRIQSVPWVAESQLSSRIVSTGCSSRSLSSRISSSAGVKPAIATAASSVDVSQPLPMPTL
jgi:hypothetical protein